MDVDQLIEKIIFPPNLIEKEQKRIEEIAVNLGYNFKFQKSTLEQTPYL